jgi:hypothetical protein
MRLELEEETLGPTPLQFSRVQYVHDEINK